MMADGAQIAKAYVAVVPTLDGMQASLTKAFGGVDTSGAGRKAGSKFSMGFGGGIESIGSMLKGVAGIAVGALGGISFANVVSGAVEASDATAKFGNTLRFAGKSQSEIESLTAAVQDYADKTVYDLSDIQNMTAQLASNGVPDFERLAEAAGNLNAVAGGNAETFKSVGMVMTQTAGAGKLTTENWNQLADAIPGASGKLQEAMLKNGAYTGNFRDAMEHGEITAQEFNQAVMQLGMEDVAKEAATSASTFEGAWGNLQAAVQKGVVQIVDKAKPAITSAMNGIADAAPKAFDMVGGAIDAITPFIQNCVKYFQQLWSALNDNGTIKTITQMFDEVKAQISGLMSSLSGMNGQWGKIIPPDAVANGVKSVADALKWFMDNSGAVEAALAGIGGAFAAIKIGGGVTQGVASFKDLKAAADLAFEGIGNGQPVFSALGGAIDALGPKGGTLVSSLGGIISKLSGLRSAAGEAGGGITGLSKALGLGKFGLVAAGIAAVAAALTVFFTQTDTGKAAWQQLTTFLSGVWDKVQAAWQAALPGLEAFGQSVLGALSGVMQRVGPVIGNLVSQVGPVIGNLVSQVGPILASLAESFGTAFQQMQPALQQLMAAFGEFGTALAKAFADSAPAVGQLITTISQAFAQIAPMVAQAASSFVGLAAAILPSIMQLATMLASTLIPAIARIVTTVAPVIAMLVSQLAPVIAMIVGAIAAFLPVVMQIVSALVSALIPVITAIINAVTQMLPVITTVINAVIAVAMPIIQTIIGVIQGVLTVLQGVITFLTGVFTGNWSQAWQGIQQVFSGVWYAITSFLSGVVNTIGSIISGALSVIQSAWNAAWNAIGTFFNGIWNGLKSAASNGLNAVVGTMSGIKGRITGFFSGAGSWLVGAGRHIVQGLIDGIKGMIGAAGDAINSVVGKISRFLPHSPAKEGPFSGHGWTPYSGQALVEGLASGIAGATGLAADAADNLAASTLAPLSGLSAGISDTMAAIDTDGIIPAASLQTKTATPMSSAYGMYEPAAQTMPGGAGLTRADVEAGVLAALQHLGGVRLLMDDDVVAGRLAPAIDRELSNRVYRGM